MVGKIVNAYQASFRSEKFEDHFPWRLSASPNVSRPIFNAEKMLQTSVIEKHKYVNAQQSCSVSFTFPTLHRVPVQKSNVAFLAIAINKKKQKTSLGLVCVKCRSLECGTSVQNDLKTYRTICLSFAVLIVNTDCLLIQQAVLTSRQYKYVL
jgi:hypothetical protein